MRWRLDSCLAAASCLWAVWGEWQGESQRQEGKKEKGEKQKTERRQLWKYYIPLRLTMSKQTADSGMSWTAMVGSFCRFFRWGEAVNFLRGCSSIFFVLASLQMWAHLCADQVLAAPPPLRSVSNHLRVCSGNATQPPDSPQPLSLSGTQPSFFHFFLLFDLSGDPPLTFQALSADLPPLPCNHLPKDPVTRAPLP